MFASVINARCSISLFSEYFMFRSCIKTFKAIRQIETKKSLCSERIPSSITMPSNLKPVSSTEIALWKIKG